MVKREFVKEIPERMSITQVEAKQFVKVFQDILTEELQQNRPLELQGFGTFSSWKQIGRAARNPKTGVPCWIEPRVSAKFRPGKFLLEALNEADK